MQHYDIGYHVFCFLINKTWYRTPEIFDDYAFDELMEMLEWKLPYNMKVFHFNSNEQPPVSKNPAFNANPIINVDLEELFADRIGVSLKQPEQEPVKVPLRIQRNLRNRALPPR